MIATEQIPMEVKRAMRAAWARRSNDDAPEKVMADLAVAAINAWPEAGIETYVNGDSGIYLPFPTEKPE